MNRALGSGSRRLRCSRVALFTAAAVVAACASSGSAAPGHQPTTVTAPGVPGTGAVRVSYSDAFSPERSSAAVRAFIPDVPAADSGGECATFKVGGLSTAMITTAYFPNRAASKMNVSLTFDSAGHLVRYSEARGFTGLRAIPPGTSEAQRDSMLRAAIAATRTMTLSFDYAIDQAVVRNRGGGKPDNAVIATPREFESMPRLGPVTERLVRVRKLCGV